MTHTNNMPSKLAVVSQPHDGCTYNDWQYIAASHIFHAQNGAVQRRINAPTKLCMGSVFMQYTC